MEAAEPSSAHVSALGGRESNPRGEPQARSWRVLNLYEMPRSPLQAFLCSQAC